jgi:hypothetical protein
MGEAGSNVTAVGLLFLLCMAVLTWCLPRRFAPGPLLITTCYMPLGQVLIVAGLHFPLFRILLLVGVCRLIARNEAAGLKLVLPDKLFLYWSAVTLVVGTLLGQLVTRCGTVYDALGAYFLFRCWLRTTDDVVGIIRFLGWMILPLAASMLIEKVTSRNIFAVLGGVPPITEQREGTLRCQGAFRHPILAGTYGATLLPAFVGLWFQGSRYKKLAIVGFASAVVVTVAAGSSGAVLAMLTGFAGIALWRFRDRMRTFRWAVICFVVGLAIVMNAPVYYVIARFSDVVGGTGWYRSYIIDQAISHFSEWWLIGSTYTAHWAPGGGSQVLATDPNNMDIINNYVAEGLGGGVLKLGLFIAIIVQGFKTVGRWIRRADGSSATNMLVWSIGVCLGAHCVSFFSVTYYDQIVVMWYWLLAILALFASQLGLDKRRRSQFRPRVASVPSGVFSS